MNRYGALFCDEYELTMAQSFWRHGDTGDVCFELFVRSLPAQRGYLVTAGVEPALDHLERLRFDDDDLAYLRERGYESGFLDMLSELRFSGSVWAIAEGYPVAAGLPLLQVVAPRVQATLVETALLGIVNQAVMVASKAARVVTAAAGRPVFDFSLRRLHGLEAGYGVARSSYIAGCAGTATVAAAQRYAIPSVGTMAHHYVVAFGEEREQAAFEQFLVDFPQRSVLLVDTYDTARGVERAIAASRATGTRLAGIRIDSGDLSAATRDARRRLDAAGMEGTVITLSGDLDEYRICDLLADGVPAGAFGVGTRMGVSEDAPSLSAVYKLVAQRRNGAMVAVMKRSPGKANDPGVHRVVHNSDHDVLALEGEPVEGDQVLTRVMEAGQRPAPVEPLAAIRERCAEQLARLPADCRRIRDPRPRLLMRSPAAAALRARLEQEA